MNTGDLNATQSADGETLLRQVRASVGAATGAMRAFAAPPGRKVMLLLAGGWPYSVRSFITGGEGMPRQELPEGEAVLGPLRHRQLLGYTIYPVDVRAPGGGIDVSRRLLRRRGIRTVRRAGDRSLTYLPSNRRSRCSTARMLALASASDDTRTFYWLGFIPRRGGRRPPTASTPPAAAGIAGALARSFRPLAPGRDDHATEARC
jgi:hypothetical protein